MAELGTLCVNADVVEEVGLNANAIYSVEAYTNKYIKKAEGFICSQARYNFVANYASVSTMGKEFLRKVTSELAAIDVIKQDMGGFTSRTEAQVMIDILYNLAVEAINLLRDEDFKQFVIEGS